MPATAKLNDIIEALDLQLEEFGSVFDCETGKVETFSFDLLHKAEDSNDDDVDENMREWEKKEWELAKLIASSPAGRFLDLPSKFDVHEWAIMEEFSRSRWNPAAFAKIFCTPSTAPGHFDISRTPFDVTALTKPGMRSAMLPCVRSQSTGAKSITSPGSRRTSLGRERAALKMNQFDANTQPPAGTRSYSLFHRAWR